MININKNVLMNAALGTGMLMLTACNGLFGGIYDEPESTDIVVPDIVPSDSDSTGVRAVSGTLYIDASSWTDWYYVDLDSLLALANAGDLTALKKALTEFTAYPIPMDATGSESSEAQSEEKPGQYMYWFDVFGQGIQTNEYRSFTPTAAQPEPASWSFAIHRNNVRTNGGAVYKTSCTDMSAIPETSSDFASQTFTEDTWSENEVWDDQSQMLLCFVPSQGIRINKELSSWLKMDIPPMPPKFTMDSSVFVLRLKNGKYAALQLTDYMSTKGVKCCLTINFIYPY